MDRPLRINMPSPEQATERAKLAAKLSIPDVLGDAMTVRELLRSDIENRAAYIEWEGTLRADAQLYLLAAQKAVAAAEVIQKALKEQREAAV